MCFGGGSPKVDTSGQDQQRADAVLARLEEDARQQRVDYGLDVIDAIFNGGEYTTGFDQKIPTTRAENGAFFLETPGAVARPNETGWAWVGPGERPKTHLRNNGKPIGPGWEFFSKEDLRDPHRQQFKSREDLNRYIYNNADSPLFAPTITPDGDMRTSSGFAPLYDDRRQTQLDFYMPQLDDQFGDARDELAFALARAGLSSSTTAGERQADLSRDFQTQDARLRSQVDADVSDFRGRVQDAKSAVTNQLFATGDASLAANEALARQQRLAADAPELSVLPALFGGITSGIGQFVQGRRDAELNRLVSELTPQLSLSDSGRQVGS